MDRQAENGTRTRSDREEGTTAEGDEPETGGRSAGAGAPTRGDETGTRARRNEPSQPHAEPEAHRPLPEKSSRREPSERRSRSDAEKS